MFAAFFLTAFPTFATLILGWLFGAAVIATLFLLRHRRILRAEHHEL